MKGIFRIIKFILFWTIMLATGGIGLILLPIWGFFTFWNAKIRAMECVQRLKSTLMQGEKLVLAAVQRRAFALFNRRAFIGMTNSRVILINRGIFGGFVMKDFQWKDLNDVTIEQNILPNTFGSNLVFKFVGGPAGGIPINGLNDETASKMYSLAQYEEQAWEEKRRIRSIEETKAAAGHIVIGSTRQNTDTSIGSNITKEIIEAKNMLDSGVISDVEFQELKSKLLSRV